MGPPPARVHTRPQMGEDERGKDEDYLRETSFPTACQPRASKRAPSGLPAGTRSRVCLCRPGRTFWARPRWCVRPAHLPRRRAVLAGIRARWYLLAAEAEGTLRQAVAGPANLDGCQPLGSATPSDLSTVGTHQAGSRRKRGIHSVPPVGHAAFLAGVPRAPTSGQARACGSLARLGPRGGRAGLGHSMVWQAG